MSKLLPIPPEGLRICVGPFSDAGLFARSGEAMVAEIVNLCDLSPDARVLDVGCGCGRLSRAFAQYLSPEGCYEGLDVAPAPIEWCKHHLEPYLPNFHFSLADVGVSDRNRKSSTAATFGFPFAASAFDLAVVSSVFTHMLPEGIENYFAELSRVLRPEGRCFMSVFMFDDAAEAAVASGSTIFDFRHRIGPCLTFDRERPEEGIACRRGWFFELIERSGFQVEAINPGNWREVRSYQVSQDHVITKKI